MQKILTRDNVLALNYSPDYSGMYVILKPDCLAEKYRHNRYQLWYCTGGFGADPTNSGRKIFGEFVIDGDPGMIVAYDDIIGVANAETLKEWSDIYDIAFDSYEQTPRNPWIKKEA